MLQALALPLVGLLISIPGLSKLPKLRLPRKAVVDTIPTVWKSHSLLAVENQYVFAGLPPRTPGTARLMVNNDQRQLDVTVDPDSGMVSSVPQIGEVPLGSAARAPLTEYSRDLSRRNFDRVWQDRSRQSVNTVTGTATRTGPTGGMRFELPTKLPGVYNRILGPGAPAINVSGSENIKLSGTSEWTNQETGLLGQKRSLFPQLDMQQDLDLRLEGQLSDRVKINLLQNSAVQIPLANKIAINYRGGEDDLVQSLDLGNTNLALPGTQYVSYSGRNEGLFGMKLTTRTGPLDFTVLASKQEGKSERSSYTGGSARQQQTLNDIDYLSGAYFFLYDPNLETQEIVESSIALYFDDGNRYANNHDTVRGRAFVDPRTAVQDSTPETNFSPTPSVRGMFTVQTPGVGNDYEIINTIYGPRYKVIKLRRPISGEGQRLAVTYRYRRVENGVATGPEIAMGDSIITDTDLATGVVVMKLLRADLSLLPSTPDGLFDPTSDFAPTRELELRNFYALAGQRIDPKSFVLNIRRGSDNPPVISEVVGNPPVSVPYLEVLGLDNISEVGGAPQYRAHDGRVDGTILNTDTRLYVDYQNGTLFFYDPRPFAPRIADNDPTYPPMPFDQAVSAQLFRRDSLVGVDVNAQNARNRAIYDKRNPYRPTDTQYYIDLEFTAARAGNEINLGKTNILDGSETVTRNGQVLVRDQDYTMDYDLGRVTLKSQLGATDDIKVDYGFAPLFQQAGRTLLGSAFTLAPSQDLHLGGAFMYESRGAQDLRPRIGEEPSRVMIGDLNAKWATRPDFLTRMVDALPGVRTTAPSDFNVEAEVGASFPNPNTYNEVFIDDMEGVRDAVTVSTTPDRWRWSSMPSRKLGASADSIQAYQDNAEVHWYTPLNAVKERELKPNLTDAQGAQNSRQVLAITVPRPPPGTVRDSFWVGLTYPLDPVGVDLSRSQFIEVWLNDFNNPNKVPRNPGQSLRLHIDLGVVSEDQRRSPGIAANKLLDSEDIPPRDNQLTVTDANNEDTGLDGRPNATELPDASLSTANNPPVAEDVAGDDFASPNPDNASPVNNLDPARWRYINGTEGNKNSLPIPDTEDLNLNNSLDRQEDYLEYTIDLGGGSAYLADSVYLADGSRRYTNDNSPVPQDNGWRRYRIPIADSLVARFGAPDLKLARHVRVWIEGIHTTDENTERPLIMIGGMEIVGSRWLASDLTENQKNQGTTVTLNSVNNVDNVDVYQPPFDPGTTRNGARDLARREQSLSLEFARLTPGSSLEAYKTFSLDEDYSRYRILRFYATGFDIPGYDPATGGLYYFVRFASDERGSNYYEYRAPVPPAAVPGQSVAWSDVQLALTDLSNLKLLPEATLSDSISAPGPTPGVLLIVKGRPSFTRLRRISFGIHNLDSTAVYSTGRLYFDELRATDVYRDKGRAQRFSVNGRMANLLRYGMTYDGRDEDFLSVGDTRGSGNRSNSYTANLGFDLHRFFEGTGISLPVNINFLGNKASPRYTAGDDVLRTGALADASETRADSRTWNVSYARAWSERTNPFLRYTIGGITANLSQARTISRNPSTVDTSRAQAAAVGYTVAPRKLLPIALPLTKASLFPLPERFFWNYSVTRQTGKTYDRLRDGSGGLVLRNVTNGRTAMVDFGADTRPLDMLSHHIQARRNLMLPSELMQSIGPINFGRVVTWNQSMDARYTVRGGKWLSPSVDWNGSYFQNNGPELSRDLSARAVNNSAGFNVRWGLPFDQILSRATSSRDTSRRRPMPIRRLLSTLGGIQVGAGASQSSSYSLLSSTPQLPYVFALTTDAGIRADSTGPVHPLFGNNTQLTNEVRANGRTRLAMPFAIAIDTRADLTRRRTDFNSVINRTNRVTFPDFEVDYGRLPELIGLKFLLTNPKLKSAYTRSQSTEYANSNTPTNVSTSAEFRPLIGLNGDFRNGTRAEFRIQHRATETTYQQAGSSTAFDSNTDVDLSLTRTYSRGQKVTFFGKQSTMKTNISLGLTGAYSRRNAETRQEGVERPINPVSEDRLNVNTRGSYGFSDNVTGNAELGFSQTRDLQRDIVRRSIRIELRAQLNF